MTIGRSVASSLMLMKRGSGLNQSVSTMPSYDAYACECGTLASGRMCTLHPGAVLTSRPDQI
jgi:hypothetical protein